MKGYSVLQPDEVTLFIDQVLLSCDVVVSALEAAGIKTEYKFGELSQVQRSFVVRRLKALGVAAIIRDSGIPVEIEMAPGTITIRI
jgi:hypothetical protein